MKLVKTPESDPIDFEGWNFGFGSHDSEIASIVSEGLEAVFAEDPPDISAPFEWGPDGDGSNGPAVDNPLTFYVSIPLSDTNGITYSFTLQEMFSEFFDEWNGGFSDRDMEIRTKVVEALESLSASLRLRLNEKL